MRRAALLLAVLAFPAALAATPGPFVLALGVETLYVPVGGDVRLVGRLTADVLGVPLETVGLRHDGVAAAATVTGVDGTYAFTFPAKARGTHIVRTWADPVDAQYHVESRSRSYYSAVPPSAPRNLAVAAIPGTLDVRVTWDAPADYGNAPLLRYEVHRVRTPGTEPALAATTAAGDRDHVEEMTPSATWTYAVAAVNVAGPGARAVLDFTAPPVPPADYFVASTPEYRRCWETPDCGHPWYEPIRTTSSPFRFWVPVVGQVANAGTAITGMPVTASVHVTLPYGEAVDLAATVKTRSDGTYEALVGPFEWGRGDGPKDAVYYVPVQAYATYGDAYLDAGYHSLEVIVGHIYGCGGYYGCGGGY